MEPPQYKKKPSTNPSLILYIHPFIHPSSAPIHPPILSNAHAPPMNLIWQSQESRLLRWFSQDVFFFLLFLLFLPSPSPCQLLFPSPRPTHLQWLGFPAPCWQISRHSKLPPFSPHRPPILKLRLGFYKNNWIHSIPHIKKQSIKPAIRCVPVVIKGLISCACLRRMYATLLCILVTFLLNIYFSYDPFVKPSNSQHKAPLYCLYLDNTEEIRRVKFNFVHYIRRPLLPCTRQQCHVASE